MTAKSFLLFLIASFSTQLFAVEYIDLPASTFEVKASNIYQRMDDIVQNPEPILRRFQPAGLKVKDKVISQNQIQFMATKVVLGVSKTVLFVGNLDIKTIPTRKKEYCFIADLDFSGSGDLIIDNIQRLEMTICTKEKAENNLVATIKSKLEKGPYYGGLISGIAKTIIADQVDPIIAAIKAEIEK